MAEDLMRYDLLVENALRAVVRGALERVVAEGLPGEHHLYITFRTADPAIVLPEYLLEKYPAEMTIVLQHQYRDLEVEDEGFSVSLSFNDINERLYIPFASVTAFADPSVNFGLQFKFDEAGEISGEGRALEKVAQPAETRDQGEQDDQPAPEAGSEDNVVTLDTFRKK